MSQQDRIIDLEKSWLLKEKHRNIDSRAYRQDVKRLESGEPLDYIIGFKPFLGSIIYLHHKPFIPEAETEYWLNKAINSMPTDKSITCLDVFAGSGCIGISILKALPKALVDFAEIEKRFVKQIKENLHSNKIRNIRYEVHKSDDFNNVPNKKYNFIFANPPYISKKRISMVQKSVLNHEPHKALFAKDNGLYFVKKIIRQGVNYLAVNGRLFIEIDGWQKKELEQYSKKFKYKQINFHKDQYNRWRLVVLSI